MRAEFKILLTLLCFTIIASLFIGQGDAEAQTYNAVFITSFDAEPNPFFIGDSTTLTINTLEFAQWFWTVPTTMVRPTIIISIGNRPFIADMTSEQMGQIGFWGSLFYWWYTQTGQWTHQVIWDGKDLQGNLVPPGPYLATATVYAGGASTFGSVVINVEQPKKIVLSLNPSEVFPEYQTVVTATVYDISNNVVPNYPITLQAFPPHYQADPCADCGGHSHDDTRPIGNFLTAQGSPLGAVTQGTTDVNGQFTINYKASQFGGVETIKVGGTQEPAAMDQKRLSVRVSGLEAMPESGQGYWRLTGSYGQPGVGSLHVDNHNGTADTNTRIAGIAADYYAEKSIAIGVNDMSLPWGGLFDIDNDWTTPHSLHRLGKSFDVDHAGVDEDTLDTIASNYGCTRYEVALIHYECP